MNTFKKREKKTGDRELRFGIASFPAVDPRVLEVLEMLGALQRELNVLEKPQNGCPSPGL